MSEQSEQERKKKLMEMLLHGDPVAVNSDGKVETREEAQANDEQFISPPQGKMARGM